MESESFLSRLRQSRLLPEPQVEQLTHRFAAGAPTHAVAASLVAEGLLTTYQAQKIVAGEIKGLVLGQYQILGELGKGGFGHVYKALHTVMGRTVALKVIAPHFVEDQRARGWFKREVLAVTQLCHPNIVMAYDANEADDVLFLVIEFVDGTDLDQLVKQQGPLPVNTACEMLRQAGLALQHAHDKGLVHRDIKPANLLVPRPAAALAAAPLPGAAAPVLVKVTDFGLARLHHSITSQTLTGQQEKNFVGTPDYVSPEQARDAGAVDIRSDLYSLGCTFFYALTGQKPFRGGSVIEILYKHMEEEPPNVKLLRPEVPAGVAAVLKRLLAKEPARRYQTPAELVAELAFVGGGGGAAAAPAKPARAALPAVFTGPSPKRTPQPMPAPDWEEFAGTRIVPELAFGTGPAPAGPVNPDADRPTERDDLGAAPTETGPATPTLVGPPPVPAAEETPNEAAPAGPPIPLEPGLVTRWRRWTEVVEALARHGDESRVNEPAYRVLHRELLEACRAHAARVGGARGPALRRLEALLEPWLTPHTLAAADPAARSSLLRRCRLLDAELFGLRRGSGMWRWAACLVVVLLAVAGYVVFTRRGLALPPRLSAAGLWEAVVAHPVPAAVVGIPVVLVSVLLARLLASGRLFRG